MTTLFVLTTLFTAAGQSAPLSQQRALNSVVMVETVPGKQALLGPRTMAGKQEADLTPNREKRRRVASGILLDVGDRNHLYVITMAHAIWPGDTVHVSVLDLDPKQGTRTATCPVGHVDHSRDLAILTVARDAELAARALSLGHLEVDTTNIRRIAAKTSDERGVVAIGHPKGEGLGWSRFSGHLVAVRRVDDAAKAILNSEDYKKLHPVAKERDCLQVDVTAESGMSGGPVYLKDFSKVLGLVWMGSQYEGIQRNVMCVPCEWVSELPLKNRSAWTVPTGFPSGGRAPSLANITPIKPATEGVKSFLILTIPIGAVVDCYLDNDELYRRFNRPTLNRVLSTDRKWLNITHNPTGFGLLAPIDYRLVEQTKSLDFFRERAKQQVLQLTATGPDSGTVTTHIYDRDLAARGNAYSLLLHEVTRYRRNLLKLGLLSAAKNDDGFLASGATRLCRFGTLVDRDVYVVGNSDVRVWRQYQHVDRSGKPNGLSTLSVIGIRGNKIVATSYEFQTKDWNPQAPLEFATRFFIVATYSFVD